MIEIHSFNTERYQPYIERIWIAINHSDNFGLTVPPSQFVDIIVPMNQSYFYYWDKKHHSPMIEGITTKKSYFQLDKNNYLVGFRFYHFGWLPFFNYVGEKLTNNLSKIPESIAINQLISSFPDQNPCIEQLKKALVYTLDQLFDCTKIETTLLHQQFYETFKKENSFTSLAEFCIKEGISYKKLHRSFKSITGISTKKFERLLKFRKALFKLQEGETNYTKIALESGYYDHSHFIKELNYFMGISPKSFFNKLKEMKEYQNMQSIDFSVF